MDWKRFWKIIGWNSLILSCTAVFFLIFNLLTHEGCPFNYLFHIPCPMCGMTRAHLAALQLDFDKAFALHPLFPIGIPYVLLLLNEGLFHGKWRVAYSITVGVMTGALLVRYLFVILQYFT